MRVTILYDNTAFDETLQSDWGFSALVEAHKRTFLFDTGASGSILLDNMEKLDIIPEDVTDVFISHSHHDHTGGLAAFLDINNDVKVWLPPSYRGVKNARETTYVKSPQQLYEGIYSTGELEGIEQSLCVASSKGVVIIAGCSHPQMKHILDAAAQFGNVYGIIGGLHGSRPESLDGLKFICATHCTQYKSEMQTMYPDAYIEGGAGKVIEI
jgi:7,8-dihydropterin-6-yl-methyl-4-(beta-D-ribofuranosyl)aminobenzene 5'-phosphate synthase